VIADEVDVRSSGFDVLADLWSICQRRSLSNGRDRFTCLIRPSRPAFRMCEFSADVVTAAGVFDFSILIYD
jgi:hypothetical protein